MDENLVAGMIASANEIQDWLRDLAATAEIKSMADNDDFSPEGFFLNPKLWDEEAGELTDEGSDEWDRLVRNEALARVRIPEITEVSDLDRCDIAVQKEAMVFFIKNAHQDINFLCDRMEMGRSYRFDVFDVMSGDNLASFILGGGKLGDVNGSCFSEALKLLCDSFQI